MPRRPVVPGCFAIETIGLVSAQPFTNRIHVSYASGVPTVAGFEDLETALHDVLDYPWTHNCGPNMTIESRRYTDLASYTGAVYEAPVGVGGTTGGAAYPASVAAVVNLNTSRRYRGGHPRQYMPGMTADSALNESEWTSSFIVNLRTDWANLGDAINTIGLPGGGATAFVAVSYTDLGVPRIDPLIEPITGTAVQTRICSQRRRLGKTVPG